MGSVGHGGGGGVIGDRAGSARKRWGLSEYHEGGEGENREDDEAVGAKDAERVRYRVWIEVSLFPHDLVGAQNRNGHLSMRPLIRGQHRVSVHHRGLYPTALGV